MEVKKGYKQTEVGVIPEDWSVKPLGSILSKGRLGGNYPNRSEETEFPLMKMGNIARGKFDLTKIEFITPGIKPEAVHKLVFGDVLFNTRNTLYLVGKVAIWRNELPVAYYNSNLMRFEFDLQEVCSSEYANLFFNTTGSITRLRALATGTTSVAAIYTRDLMCLPFVAPPVPEQRAIAEALSDTDALIESLEQLIAKKRQIKQGAMQELLTGKKRLPGFTGEWEVKRLGDVAEIVMGQSPSSSNYNTNGEGLSLIQGNADIKDRKTIERIFTKQITKRADKGDILMSVRAPVGEIARAEFDVCIGRGVCAILYDNDYMYHCLINFEPIWVKYSKGSTFESVNSADVKELELTLPSNKEEQTAIASVLSDMYAELAALEKRLDKTCQIKQGMMQNLLTGKIRLV
ncbi:MAG: restriction endonuclease subunit S [Chlorobiaceae bacterium]